uniref:Paralemmin-1 n=1 Tax=Sphaeramia orbicularis TaxID=375764 RepID=A0A672ZVV3_9TELE
MPQEKRKWQTEIENKKRQLEDDRRALQHLKSKALRERWLLDGAPSAGPEQDQVKTQLQQDEARTRTLEDTISRSVPEGFQTGLWASTNKQQKKSKVYENEQKGDSFVHEMNGDDGVQMLSSSEVEDSSTNHGDIPPHGDAAGGGGGAGWSPNRAASPSIAEASAENPVTMVFMGYQSVEDEDETKKVLGLRGTVKAELVVIDDGNGGDDGKTSPGEKSSPGGEAGPGRVQTEVAESESEGGAVQIKKEKQPCKCCSIM